MTVAQALALGYIPAQIRSSLFWHPFHGVIVPAHEPRDLNGWVAAARAIMPPDSMVTGLTALQLRGVDFEPYLPLYFATRGRFQSTRPQLTVIQRQSQVSDTGIDNVAHALTYAVSQLRLKDAVALADRTIYRKIASPASIEQWAELETGHVRRALRLSRPGAESIRETYLRLCIVLCGLPEPQTQVVIRDERGFVGRFDMGMCEYRLLIEYDGQQHRTDETQYLKDIDREQRVQALGLDRVRVSKQSMRHPWQLMGLIDAKLRHNGYQGPRPRRTSTWVKCFEP